MTRRDQAPANETGSRSPLARAVELRPGETAPVLWAFASFFLLLAGYYVLRSLREEMGIRGGVDNLPWNFTATFALMLVAQPLYARLVASLPRARAVPAVYRFFLATLLGFWLLFRSGMPQAPLARAFFVWVSVYGLFVVAVFWSLLVDLFSAEQGRRVFGFVAAGGSAGAIAGPLLVEALSRVVGVTELVLVSAALLECATQSLTRVVRHAPHAPPPHAPPPHAPPPRGTEPSEPASSAAASQATGLAADRPTSGDGAAPVGGTAWSGVALVFRDRYLLAIAAQMLLFTLGSTLIYFQVAHLVAGSGMDSAARTRLFARVDLAVNVAALLTGSLATARIVARLGLGSALALVPTLTAAGLAVAAAVPTFAVLASFQALRRAASYAVERPAREVLYTVVTREERYKSKAFVETVVYRAGDAGSAWIARGLAAAGAGVSGSLLLAIPVGLAGVAIAAWQAGEERRREATGIESLRADRPGR